MANLARLSAIALAAVALTGCPRREPVQPPEPPVSTPPPLPTPPPTPFVPNKRMEVGRMFNGMQVRTSLVTEWGSTAAVDRTDPASYAVDVQVKVRVPKPHRDLAALSKLNGQLGAVLPGLPILLDTAKVSPAFEELYRLKVANLHANLTRLDALLSRWNFYDTETVLEFEHPLTKRRALLVQSDMDTDTDGSDSDRIPDVDSNSATFQPFTSYNWPKRTAQPNPFLTPRESRLRQISQELATPNVSAARQKELKRTLAQLKDEIASLQKNSFLVATLDPYIVLPGSMFGKKGQLTPSIGDYCVVIAGNVLYPAIVGDVGPAYKSGEASLRLCKELNPRADANSSASSELKVTYLVFPGSGERPWSAPDFEKWRAKCEALLADLGGHGGELFTWTDLSKPPPPPPAPPAPVVPPAAPPATPGTPAATPAPSTPPAATPRATPAPATPAAGNRRVTPAPATPRPAAATPPANTTRATPTPATPPPATLAPSPAPATPSPATPAPSPATPTPATPKAR